MANKRQRKKAMKKYMRQNPTGRGKSLPVLHNYPTPRTSSISDAMLTGFLFPDNTIIIDSVSELWGQMLHEFAEDARRAVDVSYEDITHKRIG